MSHQHLANALARRSQSYDNQSAQIKALASSLALDQTAPRRAFRSCRREFRQAGCQSALPESATSPSYSRRTSATW